MDLVVMSQTPRRQRNALHTHPLSITITGGTTEAGIIGPRKLGEMVEITSSQIDVTTAPTTNNAKEAHSRTSNNTPVTPGLLLIKYSRRKHSNNQIDIKGPRES